jgi:hypothetical protein
MLVRQYALRQGGQTRTARHDERIAELILARFEDPIWIEKGLKTRDIDCFKIIR